MYSTVLYSVQYSTVLYSTVQYSTVQYSTVLCYVFYHLQRCPAVLSVFRMHQKESNSKIKYFVAVISEGTKISALSELFAKLDRKIAQNFMIFFLLLGVTFIIFVFRENVKYLFSA